MTHPYCPSGRAPARASFACLALQWLGALCLAFWAANAGAHATLLRSEPSGNAALAQLPSSVRLLFNEPVSALSLTLLDPGGQRHALAGTRSRGSALELDLPPLAAPGSYLLSWRVVSADGHPVGGALAYAVGPEAGAAPVQAAAAAGEPSRLAAIWLTRWLIFLGWCIGLGSVVYWCQALATALPGLLLAIGAAAWPASLGLLGLDALDLPWRALLDGQPWRVAADTSFGRSAALAAAALLLAAIAWRQPARRLPLGLLAMGTAAAAMAASGHASSAPPAWLARPALWLHLMAAMAWIGVLWPLARQDAPHADASLRIFSRLAPGIVSVLLLSGATLAWLQLDDYTALWQTAYGRILAAKLGLTALLLGLGAYHRYGLTAAVLGGNAGARRRLRRSTGVELGLAVLLLGLVAGWRFTPPPRALHAQPAVAAAAPAPWQRHIHTAAAMADLALQPAGGGRPASLVLYLSTPDGQPLPAQEVSLALTPAQGGISPLRIQARAQPDGTWLADGLLLPAAPAWHVQIEALVSDFDRLRLSTTLEPAQALP